MKQRLIALCIGWATRETIYRAVRLGGWRFFQKMP
jgi:hypothetical protein